MSSRKASQVREISGWLRLDGTSPPSTPRQPGPHRTPQGQEDSGDEGASSSDDESDRQARIPKAPEHTPRPRPPRPVVEDDAEEEEDGEIALSLGGLSLLDSFVPSQNNVEVRVVVYDLETTGLGATDKISIMELGAVAVVYTTRGWVPVDEFQCYVKPPKGAAVQASVPHEISNLQLKNAKPFGDHCGPKFRAFIEKQLGDARLVVVVGHNAKRYDHRLLFFHGFVPPLGARVRFADSIEWMKHTTEGKFPSYSINNLHKSLIGSPPPAAHNALPDCYALVRIINAEAYRVHSDTAWMKSEPWHHIRSRCCK